MARVTTTPIPGSVSSSIARQVEQRVVLAIARVETAMKAKVSRPGPPRSAPGEPPRIDTARLVQSIHSSVERRGPQIIGTVSANVEYAAALEYGTAKMAARPFARSTLAEEQPNVAAIIGAPGLVK